MKLQINIECESIHELSSHLIKLRDDLIVLVATEKLDWDDEILPPLVDLNDSNCYGTHTILFEA